MVCQSWSGPWTFLQGGLTTKWPIRTHFVVAWRPPILYGKLQEGSLKTVYVVFVLGGAHKSGCNMNLTVWTLSAKLSPPSCSNAQCIRPPRPGPPPRGWESSVLSRSAQYPPCCSPQRRSRSKRRATGVQKRPRRSLDQTVATCCCFDSSDIPSGLGYKWLNTWNLDSHLSKQAWESKAVPACCGFAHEVPQNLNKCLLAYTKVFVD